MKSLRIFLSLSLLSFAGAQASDSAYMKKPFIPSLSSMICEAVMNPTKTRLYEFFAGPQKSQSDSVYYTIQNLENLENECKSVAWKIEQLKALGLNPELFGLIKRQQVVHAALQASPYFLGKNSELLRKYDYNRFAIDQQYQHYKELQEVESNINHFSEAMTNITLKRVYSEAEAEMLAQYGDLQKQFLKRKEELDSWLRFYVSPNVMTAMNELSDLKAQLKDLSYRLTVDGEDVMEAYKTLQERQQDLMKKFNLQ